MTAAMTVVMIVGRLPATLAVPQPPSVSWRPWALRALPRSPPLLVVPPLRAKL